MRLGICGFAASGKDEVANVLVSEFGFVRLNMSDPLRHDLSVLNPFVCDGIRFTDYVAAHGFSLAKASCPEVRRLLQVYGTEVWRSVDPDIWVDRVAEIASIHDRVVTTGIRFENELRGIDVLIHVVRPGVTAVNDHVSDRDIPLVSRHAEHVLVNDGSLDLLADRTRMLARGVLRGN
jgi:hypothetical protein